MKDATLPPALEPREHPTSNIRRPTSSECSSGRALGVGCWTLNVECFPLVHRVQFSNHGFWAKTWLAALALALAQPGWSSTILVTNTADSGPGSFRQALVTASTNPGPNMIAFQISGKAPYTIMPATALPAITAPVVIDATTQTNYAGAPVVQLDGASSSSVTAALRFSAGASTLRGLAINRFPGQGIELASPSNTIQANFIGTDVTGMTQLDNGSSGGGYGIDVISAGNLIISNVISAGNFANGAGIYIASTSNNIVQGNLIGVNAAGTGAFNSVNNGVILLNSSSNLIGGPLPAARNLVSGNGQSGIYVSGSAATGNVIQGNYIGTDITGSHAIKNVSGDGISLLSAPGNIICSNLISGNGLAGVSIQTASGNQVFGNFIGTDVTGTLALTNHNSGVSISGGGGNQIGGTNTGAGNVISGNALDGITLTSGTTNNLIQGNLIGLNAAGSLSVRNVQNGITISGGTGNTIGGTVAAARNCISGNTNNGVDIALASDTGNVIQGNYIGTDITGSSPIRNNPAGIYIAGCSNLVGGTVAGAGNVISGNEYQGICINGVNGAVKGCIIQGNLIGLTAGATAGMGNGLSSAASAGILIAAPASANLVGGVAAGAANVISANNGAGIALFGGTGANQASGNVMEGNFIGTDPTGTVRQGNVFEGIYLQQAATNQIGGTNAGAGNLISGNYTEGVGLTNSSWNVIQGNLVGTAANGTNSLPNNYHNVDLQLGSSNNVVGGTASGAGNRLAFASLNSGQLGYGSYCGVRVRTGAQNNLISGNAIFSNGALGIDLDPTSGSSGTGYNPIVNCESGVAADAANAGQNFPMLSNVYSSTITRVSGSLDSASGKSYTLQFFASPTGDPSNYGEGQVYLGQTNLTLVSSSCSSNFTAYLPSAVPAGWVVTATATGPGNNTSEFSAWVPVIPLPPVILSLPGSNRLVLSWTNNGGSFALKSATNLLTPLSNWVTVTNVPVLTNHFMVTTLGLTNTSVFYRLMVP